MERELFSDLNLCFLWCVKSEYNLFDRFSVGYECEVI
jgi:hypothetical protein